MKEKLKNFFNSKILFLILGLFIGGITSAYAITYFPSNQVTYDNSSSKLSATQVQAAIDELYGKAKICSSSSSSGNIYVVREDGYVFKLAGRNLENIGQVGDSATGIAVSGNNIYVVRDDGYVFKSTGGNFENIGQVGDSATGIAVSGNNIYVVRDDGYVFKLAGRNLENIGQVGDSATDIAVG